MVINPEDHIPEIPEDLDPNAEQAREYSYY